MTPDKKILIVILALTTAYVFVTNRRHKSIEEANRYIIVHEVSNQGAKPFTNTGISIYYLSDTAFVAESGRFQKGDTLMFDRNSQTFKKYKQ